MSAWIIEVVAVLLLAYASLIKCSSRAEREPAGTSERTKSVHPNVNASKPKTESRAQSVKAALAEAGRVNCTAGSPRDTMLPTICLPSTKKKDSVL
ncbi:unnamed protein product [Heligmosomoides polygyrus]|uniref:Secreted protein n=1 Tax=Heligmosomoides polygyrus TaxID=6339 RepID=A0A183G2B8_HELPZ|nr:unnamed protein product [Heligmosomoides polygyrus]